MVVGREEMRAGFSGTKDRKDRSEAHKRQAFPFWPKNLVQSSATAGGRGFTCMRWLLVAL